MSPSDARPVGAQAAATAARLVELHPRPGARMTGWQIVLLTVACCVGSGALIALDEWAFARWGHRCAGRPYDTNPDNDSA